MEELKGYDIPFEIKTLKHRADLIEQDGPLLSLYYNGKGDYYLFYWLDSDDRANRWMILRVSIESLYQYLSKQITLLQVIGNPSDNFVWITDIDTNGKQISTKALPVANIPTDYLPAEDSWFEFDNQNELLKEVGTYKFEVDIPRSDNNLFSTIVAKRGWKLSTKTIHKFIDKVAF